MSNLEEEKAFFIRCALNLETCRRDLEELQLRIQDENESFESFENKIFTGLQIVRLVQVMILAEYAIDSPELSVFLKDNIKDV